MLGSTAPELYQILKNSGSRKGTRIRLICVNEEKSGIFLEHGQGQRTCPP